MFALVFIGPPGVGKTDVVAALSDLLVADDVRHVTLEVEAVTSAHPALGDDEWHEPVRAVCALYRRFGYELLLVTATVESRHDLDGVLAAIGADAHAVVRLEAERETLRRRITEREPAGWPGLAQLLATADRLVSANAALEGIALTVSTEGAHPPAVAGRIRSAVPVLRR
jgi:AAA domain-containing protein